jgi:serine phosphatase RsbU (regulator of sigma subunit)
MTAWIEGMASALRAEVRLVSIDGTVLASAGEQDGEVWQSELQVNGRPVGRIEVRPIPSRPMIDQLRLAVATFQSLAEARNTITDMAQTTAMQWRELSALYRSSQLLHGGMDARTVASHLLRLATAAIRSTIGLVRFQPGDDGTVHSERGSCLKPVAEWCQLLEGAVVIGDAAELRQLGYSGPAPPGSLLAVPIRGGSSRYGALVIMSEHGRMLRAEDLKLARLLADQAGQAYATLDLIEQVRQTERLQQELEVAAEIQASILPREAMHTGWLEVSGVCEPATWVGGDAYVVRPTPTGEVLAGVADVSGHGVSSALLMNAFASHLDALAMTTQQPGRLLEITNDLIAARVGSMGMFVTAVLMRLAPSGRVVIANAGHPPPLVVSPAGGVSEIAGGGVPLGVLEEERFTEIEAELSPGDFLVAYSDGLTEAKNDDGDLYGLDRLVNSLVRHTTHDTVTRTLADAVLSDLRSFAGSVALNDDLTLVVLRPTI